jgi:hypothetical protein
MQRVIRNVDGVMLSLPTKQEILGYLKQLTQNDLFTFPFDIDLTGELNVEHFELTRIGRIMFSHPDGTHDDILWSLWACSPAGRHCGQSSSR